MAQGAGPAFIEAADAAFCRSRISTLQRDNCVQNRILLVEDDDETSSFIIDALTAEGYAVDRARDGGTGLALACEGGYSAIVLDRMLPVMDGMTVLGRMRSSKVDTPTIILSALGSVDQRVEGLLAGSQDYLPKPFAMAELVARVHALVRKVMIAEEPVRHAYKDLVIDRMARTATRGGREIELQPREYRLLEYLMCNVGQIVTRKMLFEGVWDYHFDPGTNVIDVHVSRLRKKLDEGSDVPIVHTVRGIGYRLGEPGE
jgi:two-component system, OmpR family, response regulator